MNKKTKIDYLEEGKTIPLRLVQQAYDRLSYASPIRTMFGMLALTGCRISELNNMRRNMFYDDVLHWQLGKRQRKHRKIRLPSWFLKELNDMVEKENPKGEALFPISSETFCRYFTNNRHLLGDEWQERSIAYHMGERITTYKYQLKGLRKNYATLMFANNWRKWEESSVAMEFTCKEMKHSSKHITANHYVEGFDRLGISRNSFVSSPLLSECQRSLGEWL